MAVIYFWQSLVITMTSLFAKVRTLKPRILPAPFQTFDISRHKAVVNNRDLTLSQQTNVK